MLTKNTILDQIEKHNKVLITTHINPDPDAIASITSLAYYIKQRFPNKEVKYVIEDKIPDSYDNFDYLELITWAEDLTPFVQEADLIIGLDASEEHRFSRQKIDYNQATTVVIDHHEKGDKTWDFEYILTGRGSNAELIYELFFSDDSDELLTPVAKNILYGIWADTGALNFIDHSNAETIKIVYELIKRAKLKRIEEYMKQFRTYNEDYIDLLKHAINNLTKKSVVNYPDVTYTYIEKEEFGKHKQATYNKVKGTIGTIYLTNLEGSFWGFIVRPDFKEEGTYKLSFRSAPNTVNVQEICQKYFAGGGHKNASGGVIRNCDSAKEAAEKIIKLISLGR
jgi:phosphoesterase RecJ-like protein